ncbi:MAG TPA: GNAT family N-acetyltransferase [Candidatus Dormibacteraeota bacterium]|nr:GNAT family N-acetyltransferase [Candidatus Dormibacteraeota bacterium]
MGSSPRIQARRATLADVAAVARLSEPASREARHDLPALSEGDELSAPELALRLLDDLEDANLLYVAEREAQIIGFAQVTGLMVGDGGHLVELRRIYVTPDHRQGGVGRALLHLVLQDLAQRSNPPALRAWAATGSEMGRFLEAAGAAAMRQRWKVGPGGIAVRGVVYDWTVRQASPVPDRALAK